jgi:hypothetical protein
MNKANYIIFHPDSARPRVTVQATALSKNKLIPKWNGDIYVDSIGYGKSNEDPFVFNDPWLYSYCHATQLRRNIRTDCFLQKGSIILFASGENANQRKLTIDTVFIVGDVQPWRQKPLKLPIKYDSHFENNSSVLWTRHFKFPFNGTHKTVKNTYEAELWHDGKECFSFLPIDNAGLRASISFSNFHNSLSDKINKNVKGKYPVLLDDEEIESILKEIEMITEIKVLKNITIITTPPTTKNKC